MRSRRLLAALILSLASLGLTAPSWAADTGRLTVTLVDEHGAPMPGQISILGSGTSGQGGMATATVTTDLPPGEYGVASLTPWGGMLCSGLATACGIAALLGPVDTDGTLTVRAGQTTQVLLEAERPVTLAGPARVGKRLAVTWSPGMKNLVELFGTTGMGGPQVQWLRNGTPIAGATETAYIPVGADSGRSLSARVTYPDITRIQLEASSGQPVTPRTSNAVAVGKVATQAFTTVADPTVSADRQGRVRVDVTAPQQIVTGKVTVTVGSWSQTRSLRNGSARIVLPKLAPGKHTISAKYLGTSTYAPSQAKSKVITVG